VKERSEHSALAQTAIEATVAAFPLPLPVGSASTASSSSSSFRSAQRATDAPSTESGMSARALSPTPPPHGRWQWWMPDSPDKRDEVSTPSTRPGTANATPHTASDSDSDCEAAAALRARLLPHHDFPESVGKVRWQGFFVILPMFCAYASLFGLQHEVKRRLGLQDDNSAASDDFQHAVSSLFLCNLIARLGHPILFGCLSPRGRTLVAMVFLAMSMMIIAVLVMTFETVGLTWVYLAYSMGGIGIGSFESNFLSCLTAFGSPTKRVAIAAIPVGVNSVLIIGFLCMGPPFYVPAIAIYWTVTAAIFGGIIVLVRGLPVVATGHTQVQGGVQHLIRDSRAYRLWLPQLWHRALASTIDMFCIAAFCPGVMLYVYDKYDVAIVHGFRMQTHSFLALFNAFCMAGGVTGRCLCSNLRLQHPLAHVSFSLLGVALILTWVPSLAFVGGFFIMLGDGLIYSSVCGFIDTNVPKQFNLTAISYWLCLGDVGSIIGSNMIGLIRACAIGEA